MVENIIRDTVNIDETQFEFCLGRGTTYANIILRQFQLKYLAKHRKLHITFVDSEKTFNRVPRKVLWWVLLVVGILEWLLKVLETTRIRLPEAKPALTLLLVRNLKSQLGCIRDQY